MGFHGYTIICILHFVSIMCQGTTQGPRFAEAINNVTVAVGREATLECVVDHLGVYKVAWVHLDRQMVVTVHRNVISRLSRYSVSFDNQRTWMLHVSNVQQEDRGSYMCQVNTEPMMSQVGYLQVVVPPNIIDEESTTSSVAVRELQNLTLTCKAKGFPSPKITWRREDSQAISIDKRKKVNVHEGETLQLHKISRLEMGAYLCIASNSVPPSVSKRIIVDVEFPPVIWVPNQLVGAPAGTEVTIDCHIEAFPRAISYWMHENIMILASKKYFTDNTDNSYKAHMRLTINNLQPQDFGNYRCISKNSLGETEGSIRLYDIPMSSQSPSTKETKISGNVVKDEAVTKETTKKIATKSTEKKETALYKTLGEAFGAVEKSAKDSKVQEFPSGKHDSSDCTSTEGWSGIIFINILALKFATF